MSFKFNQDFNLILGNVIKGWEGLPGSTSTSTKPTTGTGGGSRKQGQKFTQQDRLCSFSSASAPTEEDFKSGSGGPVLGLGGSHNYQHSHSMLSKHSLSFIRTHVDEYGTRNNSGALASHRRGGMFDRSNTSSSKVAQPPVSNKYLDPTSR